MPHDKAWRHAQKAALIAQLGGKCVDCGSENDLEFDHTEARAWVARELWANQRMLAYIRDAAAGHIEIRCRGCNASKQRPLLLVPGEY